jgi:predicted transcriptional regulator of viral defense system
MPGVILAEHFREVSMDLAEFIDRLAAGGRYHFTTADAAAAVGSSPPAVRAAIRRLRDKGRVAMPHRGFHIIVPPEYRSLGCLPADQFVPQLMEHLDLAYYVGLLSAASLHGAAHHAPMVFQTIVAANRPPIRCGSVRVEFVARGNVAEMPVVRKNTMRGFMHISTPEVTAFDLAGYPSHAGGLSNVVTVLAELAESIDPVKLLAETERSPLPWTQRLGYLLVHAGAASLVTALAEHVASRAKEYVPLRTRKSVALARRDTRWRVLVNETIEADR